MAGLFALFVGMFMASSKIATDYRDGVKRDHAIKYAKEKGRLTYNIQGQEYYIENNKPCRTIRKENGHLVIEGTGKYYGLIFHDYDDGKDEKIQNEFERDFAWAKNNGIKYINLTKYKGNDVFEYGDVASMGIEVETGNKYVLKRIQMGKGKDTTPSVFYLENEPIYKSNLKRREYICERDERGLKIGRPISEEEYWERLMGIDYKKRS